MTAYYNYLGQAVAQGADAATWVNGDPGGGVTITAPDGPSAVSVNGGNWDTLIASEGDNTFYVNNVTDVVQAAAGLTGIKTIVSYSGGYTLPDNVQNLTFYGAGNWGAGNTLDNLIVMGGNDQNVMDGGAGNDVLVGGFGENDFQFEVNSAGGPGGHDVFYGFHPNLDTVRISGASFTSFTQIQSAMHQVGSDVVLSIDANDSITFRNMTIGAFQARDFLLPLDRSQLGAMTFDDEFNSLQLWNPATGQGQWRTTFGSDPTKLDDYAITSNAEKQLYTSPDFVGQDGRDLSAYNPFAINDGALDISAGKFAYLDSQYTWGQAYYSGMLNTRGLFMQKYGYFEMRAALPTDMGSWPAFWLTNDPYAGAEADVLESLGMYPDVAFSRSNDTGAVTGHTAYVPALSGFHTYGMMWGPTTTTFYIDDMAVMQLATPATWTQPMYMLLDMAMGGWGGPIDETGLPAQMQVDWVHVYGLASSPVQVEIGAPTYTTPDGVDSVTLIGGGGQTVTANNAGDALVSDNLGNHLIGGAGNDAITLGGGGDTAAGGGGADTFIVAAIPTTASQIADFGTDDRLDLSGLLSSLGYTGADPVADGYLKITADSAGNAQVWANPNTAGSAWSLVTTLDGVAAGAVHAQGDIVTATGGSAGGGGTAVTTGAATYTAPDGVTDITLTGAQQVIHGNDLGDTFHSSDNVAYLYGGAGNDVFDLGRGGDWAVGGGGDDVFAFAATPWGAGGITDFGAGDTLDLSGLLHTSGYMGSDPVGAGYLKFTDDGAGDAQIWSNLNSTWWLVTTLEHVAPAQLQVQGDLVAMTGSVATAAPVSGGASGGGGTAVTTSAATYTAPDGVTDVTLTGSQQAVYGNNLGDTFHSGDGVAYIFGGTGADTFNLGRGGDWAQGGGGNDTFAFAATPWAAGGITDFGVGDKVDLSGLLAHAGYTGSDPIGAGYLKITDDGSGDAQIWSSLNSTWWLVTTLEHAAPASLHVSGAFITG